MIERIRALVAELRKLSMGEPLLQHECLVDTDNGPHAMAESIADRLDAILQEEGGWRSMDSAPKDGTRMLLRLGDPWNETVIRRWSESDDFWTCDDDNHLTGSRVPVAWMPLPEPPPQEPPR